MSIGVRRAFEVIGSGLFVLANGCASVADDAHDASSSSATEQKHAIAPSGDADRLYVSQHSTWTVQRGAPTTYRVVAYGDSIFAGFQGSLLKIAKRSAPLVAGEYLAREWDANVEVVRRTRSGAVSSEVLDVMSDDRSYMAAPSTRAVYFEMCGNDYLNARKKLERATGTCDYSALDAALATCVANVEAAMQLVNQVATSAESKAIANLYYPGFDADDRRTRCTDPGTGEPANIRALLLPYMARSNWQTCSLARRHGFACVDTFAELMGADHDSDGDGAIDSEALRFDPSETEEAYVQRVAFELRATVRDANHKGLSPTETADYLLGDDIHPTFHGPTISISHTGQGAPDFTDAEIVSGKNPRWNLDGHERLGWALYVASAPGAARSR